MFATSINSISIHVAHKPLIASLRSRDADVDDALKMVAVPNYGHATAF